MREPQHYVEVPLTPYEPWPALRDQFAMAALTGFIASTTKDSPEFDVDSVSDWCYAVADAMLKAREREA